MWKPLVTVILIAVICLTLCAGFYVVFWTDSPDLRKFKQIQPGMSVDEVQALLGPGTPIEQRFVPSSRVAVNPADVEAARAADERARREGTSPATARNYPTRNQYRVEGDFILKWVNSNTGGEIYAAFKDGKVTQTYYWDPNYL